MSYVVTRETIDEVRADAAVLGIENPVVPADGPTYERLAALGGAPLLRAMRAKRFLSVGRATEVDPCGVPFAHLLLTAAPRWNNGESNEFTVLRLCYRAVYDLAERLGCESVAMPILSINYYHFPQEEAVRIAFAEAERSALETVFLAETEERYALCQRTGKRPAIVDYIGYYRDDAVFALDNGLFAFVDRREERIAVTLKSFYDPCCLAETDPGRVPLEERELDRLRGIYEVCRW